MSKRSFVLLVFVLMLLFFASRWNAFADVADPDYFRLSRMRERPSASFSLSHSENEENTLKLRLRAFTEGLYFYTFYSEDIDEEKNSRKVLDSSTTPCDKGEQTSSFSFEVPEEGEAFRYVLGASFSPKTRIKDNVEYSKIFFKRIITVRKNKGTVYVFIEEK